MNSNTNPSWQHWQLSKSISASIIHFYGSRMEDVTSEGFGTDDVGFGHNDQVSAFKQSTHASLLFDSNNTLQGFALHYIKKVDGGQAILAYVNKVCISKSFQGKGYCKRIVHWLQHKMHADVIQATTQNPGIVRLITKRARLSFPFQNEGNDFIPIITEFSVSNIPQVKRYSVQRPVDKTTAIIKGLYGKRLGNFQLPNYIKNTYSEKYLTEHQFNREKGDAVLVTGVINTKAVIVICSDQLSQNLSMQT